jgi:hypothetical protein
MATSTNGSVNLMIRFMSGLKNIKEPERVHPTGFNINLR